MIETGGVCRRSSATESIANIQAERERAPGCGVATFSRDPKLLCRRLSLLTRHAKIDSATWVLVTHMGRRSFCWYVCVHENSMVSLVILLVRLVCLSASEFG
ncbi:unnamed protein product, partial [Ectocarpus fasciculatus]